MKTSIALLLLFISLAAFAQEPSQTILSSVGAPDGWTGIETLSLGWSQDHRYRNVQIEARLANGGGSGRGIAYLMRTIGPGTTCASEVAQVSFDLPLGYDGMFVLFENLDLRAGDYWLVFSKPRRGPFSYANWMAGIADNITKSSDVRYLGMAWVNAEDLIGEYVPASAFNVRTDVWAYQLEIRGEVSCRRNRGVASSDRRAAVGESSTCPARLHSPVLQQHPRGLDIEGELEVDPEWFTCLPCPT